MRNTGTYDNLQHQMKNPQPGDEFNVINQVKVEDGAITPITDDDVDLGSSTKEFKDIYIDGVAYMDALAGDSVMGEVQVTGTVNESVYDPATRVFARADFTGKAVTQGSLDTLSIGSSLLSANKDFVLSGSGGSWSADASTDGGMVLTPGSKSSSAFAILKPCSSGRFGQINWLTNKQPRFRAVLRPTTKTTATILFGVYTSSGNPGKFGGGASGSHRVEMFTPSSNSLWRVNADVNGSDSSSVNTSVAQASGTVVDFEIRVDSSRIATAYINGALVWTAANAMTTAKELIPIVGIQTTNQLATKPSLQVYHMECSQQIA